MTAPTKKFAMVKFDAHDAFLCLTSGSSRLLETTPLANKPAVDIMQGKEVIINAAVAIYVAEKVKEAYERAAHVAETMEFTFKQKYLKDWDCAGKSIAEEIRKLAEEVKDA